MRRSKSSDSLSARKWKLPRLLLLLAAALYLLFVSFKFRHLLHLASASASASASTTLDRPALRHDAALRRDLEAVRAPPRRTPPATRDDPLVLRSRPEKPLRPFRHRYGRIPAEILRRGRSSASWAGNVSELEHMAHEAWALGQKAWADLASPSSNLSTSPSPILDPNPNPCPTSLSGQKVGSFGDQVMFLPCGLEVGSSITVIGTPEKAHSEYVAQLAKKGNGMVMVSQFIVELQGLKAVDGEDPPRILHFNPRIKGDWSKKPVIELNTCYRMQWGNAMRCDGETAKDDDETVDGLSKCEKWVQSDIVDSKESKTTSWLNRFIGRAKKPEISWPFPFVEGKLFVLTLRAGAEGYHIYVGGRHVISFPYRTGFALEDATGLAIKGNVDVHSVYATSLPKSHPSFSLLHVLEMSEEWKSPPLPEKPIHVFVGILSATNHFAERMAIRKTWMQYPAIRSSNVVARFFVALSPNKEVNAILKKEAEYFGDIVILPFMDRYELVVLKTLAICEFGVLNMTADYIMKCDDDTFVRLDVILREIDSLGQWRSLYMGNLNLLVRPLRSGKWAVTYEEWPEEIYPPYANGPGYIISNDIARFIVSKHANQTLRLFKMEDVSMGMWVEEFNAANNVKYSHSWKFCQYGCMENYYTAHYQSPRQMICLWDKLARGRAQCCNFR